MDTTLSFEYFYNDKKVKLYEIRIVIYITVNMERKYYRQKLR